MHAFDNGAAQRQAEHWRRSNGLDKPEEPTSTPGAETLQPGQRRARNDVEYIDIVERQPGPGNKWTVRYPDDVTMPLWGPTITMLYPDVVDVTPAEEVQEAPTEDPGETVVVAGRVVTERDLRDAVTLFRDLGVVLTLAYEVEDVTEDEAAARNHVSKLVQAYVDQLPPETPAEAQEAIREHLSRIAH